MWECTLPCIIQWLVLQVLYCRISLDLIRAAVAQQLLVKLLDKTDSGSWDSDPWKKYSWADVIEMFKMVKLFSATPWSFFYPHGWETFLLKCVAGIWWKTCCCDTLCTSFLSVSQRNGTVCQRQTSFKNCLEKRRRWQMDYCKDN